MKSTQVKTSPDYSNLIGVPYARLNCWDIVVEFYKQVFNLTLEKYYSSPDPSRGEVCGLIRANARNFVRVDSPEFGDILTIKIHGIECHIAIYLGNGLILHTQKNTGSVVDKLSRWSRLVSGYYRVEKETIK